MKAQRYCLWSLWFLVCCGCATINPATGRQEFIIFTTPNEVMLGQEIDAQIRTQMTLSKDNVAQVRLSLIGQRVAQVSDRQDYQYHFYLIEKDEMNAFTTPGGSIYFYTGLYRKLKTDDQIAAVLAHEIGHCAGHHVIKKFQASLGYNLVGAVVFGQIQNELAMRIARLGADTLVGLGMSAYSRQDELEADRLGVKYMYLARYQPEGMVQTFEMLGEGDKGRDDGTWLLLRSHPDLKDRIALVKKEIELVKSKY